MGFGRGGGGGGVGGWGGWGGGGGVRQTQGCIGLTKSAVKLMRDTEWRDASRWGGIGRKEQVQYGVKLI